VAAQAAADRGPALDAFAQSLHALEGSYAHDVAGAGMWVHVRRLFGRCSRVLWGLLEREPPHLRLLSRWPLSPREQRYRRWLSRVELLLLQQSAGFGLGCHN